MTVEQATQILEDVLLKDGKTDSAAAKTEPQSPKFAKRRRPWAPRSIPRDNLAGKDSSRKRPPRRRNDSEMSSRQHRRGPRNRTTSEVSTVSDKSAKDSSPLKALKETVTDKYDKKGRHLLDSYLKNRRELVIFENKAKFLQQCKAFEVVPVPYRLTNFNIKNTKVIRRILDKFSLQLMFADLNYCRKRCDQINKLLAERVDLMKELYDEQLATDIFAAADETAQRRSKQLQEKHEETFKSLVQEYKLTNEDLEAAAERLKLFEQLDKERHERRIQKQLEKDEKGEDKPKPAVEDESEDAKKTQEEKAQ